jgi:hypothetical protein
MNYLGQSSNYEIEAANTLLEILKADVVSNTSAISTNASAISTNASAISAINNEEVSEIISFSTELTDSSNDINLDVSDGGKWGLLKHIHFVTQSKTKTYKLDHIRIIVEQPPTWFSNGSGAECKLRVQTLDLDGNNPHNFEEFEVDFDVTNEPWEHINGANVYSAIFDYTTDNITLNTPNTAVGILMKNMSGFPSAPFDPLPLYVFLYFTHTLIAS